MRDRWQFPGPNPQLCRPRGCAALTARRKPRNPLENGPTALNGRGTSRIVLAPCSPTPPPKRGSQDPCTSSVTSTGESGPQSAQSHLVQAWARLPGSSTSSIKQTIPTPHSVVPDLVALLDYTTGGELIPELACHGLQSLIQLELATLLGVVAMNAPKKAAASATSDALACSPPRWVTFASPLPSSEPGASSRRGQVSTT